MNVTLNANSLELTDLLLPQYLRPDPPGPGLHHLDQPLGVLSLLVSASQNCPHKAPSDHQKLESYIRYI